MTGQQFRFNQNSRTLRERFSSRKFSQDFTSFTVSSLSERVLRDSSALTIVQVGANDGITNDPLFPFFSRLTDSEAKVYLVEPQPDAFERLQKNYSKRPNGFTLVNSALTETGGKIAMYRINPSKTRELRKWYNSKANPSGVTSVYRQHVWDFLVKVVGHAVDVTEISEWIERIEVNAISVPTFLHKYSIKTVDVLQVDAEGYDWQVVKVFLDAQVFPRVINFEVKNLSPADFKAASYAMDANGFSTHQHRGDLVAFRAIRF